MRWPARLTEALAVAGLFMAFGNAGIVRAQDGPMQDPGPPERGVARISVVNGEVSVRRGDSGDWVAAAVNAPLMVQDRLATGAGSRAEVQFDSANLIRVGANAEIRMAQLDNGRYTIQVAHGTVTYRVLRNSRAQVEVQTPPVSVRPVHVGSYRIYVQPDGQTEITVRSGDVQVYTPRGTEQLQSGQTMLVRGDPSDPEFKVVPGIAYDTWDQWNDQRDRELHATATNQHVPEDVYGTEGMDEHGRWVDVPQYGEVWTPQMGPDWAPYQNGSWVWEDYYGWTWVGNDPWGWAPYHWGRWFYAAPYGWSWYPGGLGPHYWAPGLVAFFGFGGHVGVGFGFGSIGWVPLAPFEPLYAWWGRGVYAGFRNTAVFSRNINVTNVNITNVYRNARVTNGISTVSAANFQQGRFNSIAHVAGGQIHDAGLARGQLPVAPSAANLRFTNRSVSSIPRSSESMRFFGGNRVPAVQRVPFQQQQRAMQQFNRQAVPSTRSGIPATGAGASGWRSTVNQPSQNPGVARSVNPGSSAGGTGGWRPLNESQAAPGAVRSPVSGWQRFGEPRPGNSMPTARSNGGWTTPRPSNYPTVNSGYRTSATPESRPQSIRVAPPVVRERSSASQPRSAPRNEGGGSHSGAGGASSHSGGGGSHGGGGHR